MTDAEMTSMACRAVQLLAPVETPTGHGGCHSRPGAAGETSDKPVHGAPAQLFEDATRIFKGLGAGGRAPVHAHAAQQLYPALRVGTAVLHICGCCLVLQLTTARRAWYRTATGMQGQAATRALGCTAAAWVARCLAAVCG